MQYVGFHENRVVRGSDDIGYYGISVAILMRLLLNCELDVLSDDGVYDRHYIGLTRLTQSYKKP